MDLSLRNHSSKERRVAGSFARDSRLSAELFFELQIADLNHRRSSMRAAVGEIAGQQVFNQFEQFRFPQGIVRLHCMAAHGFGNHVLAKS